MGVFFGLVIAGFFIACGVDAAGNKIASGLEFVGRRIAGTLAKVLEADRE